ncbi:PREDICTED: inhibitor of growth protein 5 isoform X2 [Rhagoletis zephyria]|uniref:inhibitor of growth protein 5 isoform X2 n=1 Tax=Rhagoletis zephyria TaxID=28612 RepID=UPI0008115E91|nr:PREDICTED: inhibitor of growth protein 5 isoform X2 [Rhagoletis zephyria]XP_036320977.1 inhibitor of growth protein 5 isoform X4 [Rhagoletis pomonella]
MLIEHYIILLKKDFLHKMSSAIYLENYLDGLESLPTELERNFKLMRKLDDRAQTAMKSIDSRAKEFMHKLAANGGCTMADEERKERLMDIQALFGKAKEYSDDKVQLAIQTYELVDKQIRRLDNDLARFEGEIQEKASSTRSKSEEAVVKKGRKKTKDTKTSGKRKRTGSSDEDARTNAANVTSAGSGGGASGGGQGSKKKRAKKNADIEDSEKESCLTAATHPSDVLDMPVDPNEPTYCLCHQVSYGEMIGCDNPDCPIEWFHFACVGLTTKPKGKWFCPKCTQDRKKK